MEQLSRSEIKRQHKQIESAAREIAALSDGELTQLGIDHQLVEAITLTRSLKAGALKRQIKYIAKLLKEGPSDDILERLKRIKGSKLQESTFHHQAERHRDAIINETIDARKRCLAEGFELDMDWPSTAIDIMIAEFSDIDEREVRRSAYRYAKSRNSVHYRELFRIIRAAIDRKRLGLRQDTQVPQQ